AEPAGVAPLLPFRSGRWRGQRDGRGHRRSVVGESCFDDGAHRQNRGRDHEGKTIASIADALLRELMRVLVSPGKLERYTVEQQLDDQTAARIGSVIDIAVEAFVCDPRKRAS